MHFSIQTSPVYNQKIETRHQIQTENLPGFQFQKFLFQIQIILEQIPNSKPNQYHVMNKGKWWNLKTEADRSAALVPIRPRSEGFGI